MDDGVPSVLQGPWLNAGDSRDMCPLQQQARPPVRTHTHPTGGSNEIEVTKRRDTQIQFDLKPPHPHQRRGWG
jgi:hypothetical protein